MPITNTSESVPTVASSIDRWIKYFKDIPDKLWQCDKRGYMHGARCVLGHIESVTTIRTVSLVPNVFGVTENVLAFVNNGAGGVGSSVTVDQAKPLSKAYFSLPTPKERVVAFLRDIRDGKKPI